MGGILLPTTSAALQSLLGPTALRPTFTDSLLLSIVLFIFYIDLLYQIKYYCQYILHYTHINIANILILPY